MNVKDHVKIWFTKKEILHETGILLLITLWTQFNQHVMRAYYMQNSVN